MQTNGMNTNYCGYTDITCLVDTIEYSPVNMIGWFVIVQPESSRDLGRLMWDPSLFPRWLQCLLNDSRLSTISRVNCPYVVGLWPGHGFWPFTRVEQVARKTAAHPSPLCPATRAGTLGNGTGNKNMKIKINLTQGIGLNRWLNWSRVFYLMESIFFSKWIAFQAASTNQSPRMSRASLLFLLEFSFQWLRLYTFISHANYQAEPRYRTTMTCFRFDCLWLSHSWTALLVCRWCKNH